MGICCDLEVDVNGEEIFMVEKKIIASYSGRLRTLFGKSKGNTRNLKVIFHDFPGGPEGFELMLKYCYNNGQVELSPSNIYFLHSAAEFLEMNNSISGTHNLLEQTEKSIQEISFWTWPHLLIALKQYQDLPKVANFSVVLQKCVDSLAGRLCLASETSPCPSTSSPDSSGFRLSCDSKSTESLKTISSRNTWWFEDLLVLSPNLVEMLVKSTMSRNFDHILISKFLIHYQKSKFFTSPSDEKRKITEMVVDVLYVLENGVVSCKSLFGILRAASSLNINISSRSKLESMVGLQLDQATLDNLLVMSPYGVNYLYDVNLVLRFLKAFMRRGIGKPSPLQLKRVASLMDLYLAEVAPDPCLKPSKFLALATALPDSARESYDDIFHAVDMYLEVHSGISEDEKMKICGALICEKLSSDVCIHLSRNSKFPSKFSLQVLISRQFELKSLAHGAETSKSGTGSPFGIRTDRNMANKNEEEDKEEVVVYAEKLDIPNDNEKLSAHLQGMQWRVMELERVCRKMQTQMAKIMKSRSSSRGPARLPWLCS